MGTGTAGTGTPGSAGTSGGAGTSGQGGTAGTTGTAGTGGPSSGTAGSGGTTAGTAGATGAAGTTGSAGTSGAGGDGNGGRGGGQAGTAGSAGGSAGTTGRGGQGGTAGTSGSAGRGGQGGIAGTAGTGGSTPTGGTGGTASNPVTPTKNGNRYRFTFGDVVFEIDAMTGARVATLSLAGSNIIVPVPQGTDPTTWGSVFWTSPRSAWTPVDWPPPAMIDSAPYTGNISGHTSCSNGPVDTSIGVSMSKDYAADAGTGWMNITYTINATKAMKAAPWEVSRVPRGGIVFFPAARRSRRAR